MFSGKTEELLRRLRRAEIAGQSVAVFSPAIDDRYGETTIGSHDGRTWESTVVGERSTDGGADEGDADEAWEIVDHLRSVCRSLNTWVVPHQAAVPQASRNATFEDGEGRITNESLEERVRVLGRRVVEYANIEPDPSTFEADENVGAGD